ncbi:MAG: TetR/AcrR family transcriptional regulator [Schleiferiaceae bacterium]
MKSPQKETVDNEIKILEAAEKLFFSKGFAGTSTTMIAKEVGCNQALVHYYFRTKENLFQAIFEKKIKLFLSTLLAVGNEELSFEDKLRKKIETHFDMIAANPQLPLFFFNELNSNPDRIPGLKEAMGNLPLQAITQLEVEIQTEVKAGRIRKIPALDLLLTIVSLNMILFVAQPIIKIFTGATDKDFEEIVKKRREQNVSTILNSLRP